VLLLCCAAERGRGGERRPSSPAPTATEAAATVASVVKKEKGMEQNGLGFWIAKLAPWDFDPAKVTPGRSIEMDG
jgi:hypothetical protein